MSKFEDVIIDCPNCHKEFPTRLWVSANVTLDPHLKEEIKEGTFNLIKCPGCKGTGSSPTPVLYHDMDKNLMIYVMPGANRQELQEGKKEVEKSVMESFNGSTSKPSVYALDDIHELRSLVDRLDSAQYADGSFPHDLSLEEWKDIVDSIINPPRAWPLDHKCICGEEIRTACFCIDEGVDIDMRAYEPKVRKRLKVKCPKCRRRMIAFTCEKCRCTYTWQLGVVDNITE